jgi:hypothetical protein
MRHQQYLIVRPACGDDLLRARLHLRRPTH